MSSLEETKEILDEITSQYSLKYYLEKLILGSRLVLYRDNWHNGETMGFTLLISEFPDREELLHAVSYSAREIDDAELQDFINSIPDDAEEDEETEEDTSYFPRQEFWNIG